MCYGNQILVSFTNTSGVSPSQFTNFTIVYQIRVDPIDATKFALYYQISFNTDLSLANAIVFRNPNRGAPGSGTSLTSSTTFTMSGLTFNIDIYSKGTISSPTISGSRSAYTYP